MTEPVKRGRPVGSTTGPRPGSRPHRIASLKVGDRTIFEAGPGGVTNTMGQVSVDIQRLKLCGKIKQRHCIAIAPDNDEVIHIIVVERIL